MYQNFFYLKMFIMYGNAIFTKEFIPWILLRYPDSANSGVFI